MMDPNYVTLLGLTVFREAVIVFADREVEFVFNAVDLLNQLGGIIDGGGLFRF